MSPTAAFSKRSIDWRRLYNSRSIQSPRNSGSPSSRSVDPVGAVSKTTRSYGSLSSRITPTKASKSAASYAPGVPCDISSWRLISFTIAADTCSESPSRIESRCRWTSSSGSISIASSPSTPSTGAGSSPNDWSKTSETEWAGSVETTSVESPALAHLYPYAHDTVVLPTPPLPPKKTNGSIRSGTVDPCVR